MAHEDLNSLLNELLPFAKQCLERYGEFFPFGAYVDAGGGIGHVSGYTGVEQAKSDELINLMIQGFRTMAMAGEIRGTCICLDVRRLQPGATEKSDAICARLEHENGETFDVYLPYHRHASGEYEYGELFASLGRRVIFQAPTNPAQGIDPLHSD